VTDTGNEQYWRNANNSFDQNVYIVTDGTFDHWTFNDLRLYWDGIRELGYEKNGELIVERPARTALSCDR
jgi:hypothetical protein